MVSRGSSVAGVALTGGGALLLYSAVKGKKWTSALRKLISGESPVEAANNPITGTTLTGGEGSTGVGAPANSSQKAVFTSLLTALLCPPTQANIQSLVSWSAKEAPWNASPPDGVEYTHNPFNTTYAKGATGEVNSVGVRIYPNWTVGLSATAATLQNYPEIVGRLRTGKGLCGWSSGEFSTWSGGGYSSVC
jgi:hypothetical protein